MRNMTLDIFGFLGAGRLGSEAAQVQCFCMGWELAWETWLGAPRSMSAQALCFDQLGATKAIGNKFIWARFGH